jgi:hypothetical protein
MDVVGGELGGDPAPGEREPGADHRDRWRRTAGDADQVGADGHRAQRDQHERDRLVAGVGGGVRGCGKRRAEHPEHDRCDRDVLAAARVLVQQPPAEPQQHDQPGRERRLHDHQRHQQQRRQLQRPAEDRNAGAGQPASAPEQVAGQPEAQVLGVRDALGVHSLQPHP